jgi:hypothetical protein
MPSKQSQGRGRQRMQGYRSIPRLRLPAAIPQGPRMYQTPRDKGFISEFTNVPVGFNSGTTSTYEWMIYLGFAKIFGLPNDPRVPPFFGAPGIWGYQVGSRQQGSAVIDFVVYPNRRTRGRRMAFRVQTEYFHNYTDAERQAYDLMQLWNLSDYNDVVDLYDYEFAHDPTGQATCILLKRAMNGELWSPIGNTGVAMRVRPGRTMG